MQWTLDSTQLFKRLIKKKCDVQFTIGTPTYCCFSLSFVVGSGILLFSLFFFLTWVQLTQRLQGSRGIASGSSFSVHLCSPHLQLPSLPTQQRCGKDVLFFMLLTERNGKSHQKWESVMICSPWSNLRSDFCVCQVPSPGSMERRLPGSEGRPGAYDGLFQSDVSTAASVLYCCNKFHTFGGSK